VLDFCLLRGIAAVLSSSLVRRSSYIETNENLVDGDSTFTLWSRRESLAVRFVLLHKYIDLHPSRNASGLLAKDAGFSAKKASGHQSNIL
jgi:hypothetical protein